MAEKQVRRSRILGIGSFVPPRVVTNKDLESMMETTDEWIVERTGIRERRWVEPGVCASDLGLEAAKRALDAAHMKKEEIQLLIFATLSADHDFPGTGVFLQRKLGLGNIAVLDIRQQCTGFIYGLSIADQFVRSGMYDKVMVVGGEVHSVGLDLTTTGRDVSVLFGDGAGAAIVGVSDDPERGILSSHLHADGNGAEDLWVELPGCVKQPRLSVQDVQEGRHFPKMNGKRVFKNAVTRMPEAVFEALIGNGLNINDLDLLVPHQANLRINEFVQKLLGLPDSKVVNNIQKYGNTTAATIPIALDEALRDGRIKDRDLVCLVAFGAGYTWGSVMIRW